MDRDIRGGGGRARDRDRDRDRKSRRDADEGAGVVRGAEVDAGARRRVRTLISATPQRRGPEGSGMGTDDRYRQAGASV